MSSLPNGPYAALFSEEGFSVNNVSRVVFHVSSAAWHTRWGKELVKKFVDENVSKRETVEKMLQRRACVPPSNQLAFDYYYALEHIGRELLCWVEKCEKTSFGDFRPEYYLAENIVWSNYQTIDRMKTKCPSKKCSYDGLMCDDCKNGYVKEFYDAIPKGLQKGLEKEFGYLEYHAVAIWVLYSSDVSDTLQMSVKKFEEAMKNFPVVYDNPLSAFLKMTVIAGDVVAFQSFIHQYWESEHDRLDLLARISIKKWFQNGNRIHIAIICLMLRYSPERTERLRALNQLVNVMVSNCEWCVKNDLVVLGSPNYLAIEDLRKLILNVSIRVLVFSVRRELTETEGSANKRI